MLVAAAGLGAVAAWPAVAAPPDGRGYELVSHPGAGEDVQRTRDQSIGVSELLTMPLFDVAPSGNAVLYSSRAALNLGDETGLGSSYRARRTEQGWVSEYVGVPGSAVEFPPPGSFRAKAIGWSSDLSQVIYYAGGFLVDPADPDADQPGSTTTWGDLYLVRGSTHPTWLTRGSDMDLSVTSDRQTPVGMAEDGSSLVFASSRRLEPGATALPALYERIGGVTRLVNLGPDESLLPLPGVDGAYLGTWIRDRAVSQDGSRIYFVAVSASGARRVYVRDGGVRTLEVSESELPTPEVAGDVTFEGSSADAETALIGTAEKLTEDDTDTSVDLYLADVAPNGAVDLTRASTAAPGAPSDGNQDACTGGCQAQTLALSPDGTTLYFMSREPLATGAAADGRLNLFMHRGGETLLVATLAANDTQLTGDQRWSRDARMTPDGHRLVFVSRAQLTDRDNAGFRHVYLYNADDQSTVCVSCPSAGAATDHAGIALPNSGGIRTRSVTDDGRLMFFHAPDGLVPEDDNHRVDVYQFDVGAAEVSLISSGQSSDDSFLYGNSGDGRDVFFTTTERLAPQDPLGTGGLRRMYDARVGGGFPFEVEEACDGDGCRGAPTPAPSGPSAGSGAFFGPESRTAPNRFSIVPISRAARRRLVRTGTLRLRVRTSAPGRLTARAKTAMGGRTRTIARAARRVAYAGAVRLDLRLSSAGRRELRKRGRLRIAIVVRHSEVVGVERTRLLAARASGRTR
jgi:WD40-like Beta Propeller Repeat